MSATDRQHVTSHRRTSPPVATHARTTPVVTAADDIRGAVDRACARHALTSAELAMILAGEQTRAATHAIGCERRRGGGVSVARLYVKPGADDPAVMADADAIADEALRSR
jgi:hypothetical protein